MTSISSRFKEKKSEQTSRKSYIETLGNSGDRKHLHDLIGVLKGNDFRVRSVTVEAIAKILRQNESVVMDILEALSSLPDGISEDTEVLKLFAEFDPSRSTYFGDDQMEDESALIAAATQAEANYQRKQSTDESSSTSCYDIQELDLQTEEDPPVPEIPSTPKSSKPELIDISESPEFPEPPRKVQRTDEFNGTVLSQPSQELSDAKTSQSSQPASQTKSLGLVASPLKCGKLSRIQKMILKCVDETPGQFKSDQIVKILSPGKVTKAITNEMKNHPSYCHLKLQKQKVILEEIGHLMEWDYLKKDKGKLILGAKGQESLNEGMNSMESPEKPQVDSLKISQPASMVISEKVDPKAPIHPFFAKKTLDFSAPITSKPPSTSLPSLTIHSSMNTPNSRPPSGPTSLTLPSGYSARNITGRQEWKKSLSQRSNFSTNPTNLIVKTVSEPESAVQLSDEQDQVLQLALSGKSLFFTGAAGTGKSLLLKRIIQELQKKYEYNEVYVTASTGVAACNIGGCTLHSFAGIGIGDKKLEEIIPAVLENSNTLKRWRSAEVLIVDEVSMIDPDFFDKLEAVGREARKRTEPFGGIQVIFCGDFLQLPPVFKGGSQNLKFCFESKTWNQVIGISIELKKIFRQKDSRFINVLNDIRVGRLTPQSRSILESCKNTQHSLPDGIKPTTLYPKKLNVESENLVNLQAISDSEYVYKAEDEGRHETFIKKLDELNAPKELHLKVGAQVILLRNLNFDLGYVNGARGKVIAFEEVDLDTIADKDVALNGVKFYPIVQFESGRTLRVMAQEWKMESGGSILAMRRQIPLTLGWALSVHKSQGMTISNVVVSLAECFEYGMAYVALSRATSLEGLKIVGHFNDSVIK
eukprot:TRINITY_DN8127_c0_g1_i2.p1 TRINITY_DN8127_c0_g1~~TRINITY_DN8127_c0_g1_i2.p1  ORF type:complete len:871 (-),score=219.35 TRINITY_DN8127_c0_g1_i2:97-2709(-)